jgi:RNA polymerase sigma-70 factor, ECF subfamily
MDKKRKVIKTSHKDDTQLVLDFQAQDEGAFDELVSRYMDMIFNLCFRVLGDYDDANDCAQETFIKVYKNLNNFEMRSGFSTWIYRIAVNTCKNHLSSGAGKARKKNLSLDVNDKNNRGAIEIEDSSGDPVKVFEKREMEAIIRRAIESLPGEQRILIILRDIEGRPYDEISSITAIKIGTVKSRIARAREHLREMLEGVF